MQGRNTQFLPQCIFKILSPAADGKGKFCYSYHKFLDKEINPAGNMQLHIAAGGWIVAGPSSIADRTGLGKRNGPYALQAAGLMIKSMDA